MRTAPPTRFETRDFIMRPWSADDAGAFARAINANEAHLRAWTPWVVDGRTPGLSIAERLREHAAKFAAGAEWVYAILTPDGSDILGSCGLYPRVGQGAMEIGYWLAAAQTGRGLATKATALLTRAAFVSPDIERVEIRCDPRNVASGRVPHRLGYSVEGGEQEGLTIWCLTRSRFAASALYGP